MTEQNIIGIDDLIIAVFRLILSSTPYLQSRYNFTASISSDAFTLIQFQFLCVALRLAIPYTLHFALLRRITSYIIFQLKDQIRLQMCSLCAFHCVITAPIYSRTKPTQIVYYSMHYDVNALWQLLSKTFCWCGSRIFRDDVICSIVCALILNSTKSM